MTALPHHIQHRADVLCVQLSRQVQKRSRPRRYQHRERQSGYSTKRVRLYDTRNEGRMQVKIHVSYIEDHEAAEILALLKPILSRFKVKQSKGTPPYKHLYFNTKNVQKRPSKSS